MRELRSLGEVMVWAFAQRPPFELVDVVVQDEYTPDVVLAGADGRHLVFDTT